MQSIKSKIMIGMIRNRHLFKLKLKPEVVDENFDLDCIPEDQKKACGSVWLQPCDYGKGQEKKTQASMQRCVDLTLKNPYLRTGIQLHKILAIK
jgi:hypothetical protein